MFHDGAPRYPPSDLWRLPSDLRYHSFGKAA
jgi:hypothetical protein